MRLTEDFYNGHATELAPLLLGKLICRKIGNTIIKCRITETECYFGEEDTACHAHKGKTNRTKIMYEPGGRAYIYLCYGIHSLFFHFISAGSLFRNHNHMFFTNRHSIYLSEMSIYQFHTSFYNIFF
ncbi:MAG: DNA-3-methyladenine glycosylase [Clostridia bacterium]|nr:DNA-3-methyladenine glycosylase [Clostridia bacterium]